MIKKNIVRLKVTSSERSPEQITQAIGLPSSKSWHIGDNRANTIISEKLNGWIFESNLPHSASLEDHVGNLLDRLSTQTVEIKHISEKDSVEFSCVVYASATPALNFSKEVLQCICEMGASLDIDLYIIE